MTSGLSLRSRLIAGQEEAEVDVRSAAKEGGVGFPAKEANI